MATEPAARAVLGVVVAASLLLCVLAMMAIRGDRHAATGICAGLVPSQECRSVRVSSSVITAHLRS
jgi:hypothetical protein